MPEPEADKRHVAVAYGLAGVLVLVILALVEDFPPLWEWSVFAAAFAYLEWRSVEVNDRLLVSSTVMIAMTAAVVFGAGSAALGIAAMAAIGPLTPRDVLERRWFQPVANFGQMVITAAATGALVEAALPSDPITARNLWQVAVAAAVIAVVYGAINFGLVVLAVRVVFRRRDLRPWSGMTKLVPSYLTMGFLGGLLGAAYLVAGPVTLPLILSVFLVGHLSFASYAQVREAHEATLRGFIKALEAKDPYTRGHTERVAYFAQLAGEELGYRGDRLERIRIAALIHDIGKLAVPRSIIRKPARLSAVEYQQMQDHAHMVEHLLEEVDFLRPMVEVASGHHSRFDGYGYGGSGHVPGRRPPIESCILAVADAFDAMTSTRSYRMALSQEFAFSELRRGAGTQFDPEVVEAFVRAVTLTGERYGSTGVVDDAYARRLAEDRVAHVG